MPLIKTEKITSERIVGIWHITESFDELIKALSPKAKYANELGSFKVESKKLEWLAARLTIKKLAEEMGITYHGIDKNKEGKPLLADSKVEISLTHSYPYVAGIIDKKNSVGIDLEQPKEKLHSIAHKFLSDHELASFSDSVVKLCIAWCAKETLYKIHSQKGLIFKTNLLLDPIEEKSNGYITGNIIVNDSLKRHKLEYLVTDDFVITYNI